MRLVSIGVMVGFIALCVAVAPTGSASNLTANQGDCWISINDPTNPTWTDDCEELPEFNNTQVTQQAGDCWISINDPTNPTWTDDCEELPDINTAKASKNAEGCWISLNDPTNPTWTDECEEILDVAVVGVQADTPVIGASFTLDPSLPSGDESGCTGACSPEANLNTVADLRRVHVIVNASMTDTV